LIVVDSSVWIDYFNGVSNPESDRLDALLGVQALATVDAVLTEVLQGFGRERDFQAALDLMQSLAIITIGGQDVAVQAARNYRSLRSLGVTVRKTIDTLIATRCILDGHALLYVDRDFDPFVQHLGLTSVMTAS
jgi:predicted nucleic acid-binding protein